MRWPLLFLTLAACGGEAKGYFASTGWGATVGPNVGQGGSQDFGQFRAILESGALPGPETLDDVGFFNEHHIALPAPDCGDDVCVHGLLGVLENLISGVDCTLVLVGMNSPIDPTTLERPPLNLTIVIDGSGSMTGTPIHYVRTGLTAMLDELEPEDRISLVRFDTESALIFEDLAADDPAVIDGISMLVAGNSTNLYAGLRQGFETAERTYDPTRQNRVVLLSDGDTNVGITDADRILALAEGYNALGYGLSTIGMGDGFNVDLISTLAESGGGAYYYVEDPEAVVEVFTEEVQSWLVPIATDVRLEIDVTDGWHLGGFYGTNLSTIEARTVRVDIPTVQIAHRVADDDNELGRRGGGGAMMLELVPIDGVSAGQVGTMRYEYDAVFGGTYVSHETQIVAPDEADQDGGWVFDASVEKGFVVLNLYMAFDMAATSASAGDWQGALAVLDAVNGSVQGWVDASEEPDADIVDDLRYVRMFIDNIEDASGQVLSPAREPADPWPMD